MCCAKWFNSEEVKLIDAEDTDVHDLRLKYAGKTTAVPRVLGVGGMILLGRRRCCLPPRS